MKNGIEQTHTLSRDINFLESFAVDGVGTLELPAGLCFNEMCGRIIRTLSSAFRMDED
jgi:hypothetical protein